MPARTRRQTAVPGSQAVTKNPCDEQMDRMDDGISRRLGGNHLLGRIADWSGGRGTSSPAFQGGRLLGGQGWWARYGEPVNAAALEQPVKDGMNAPGPMPMYGGGYVYGPGSCDCPRPCVAILCGPAIFKIRIAATCTTDCFIVTAGHARSVWRWLRAVRRRRRTVCRRGRLWTLPTWLRLRSAKLLDTSGLRLWSASELLGKLFSSSRLRLRFRLWKMPHVPSGRSLQRTPSPLEPLLRLVLRTSGLRLRNTSPMFLHRMKSKSARRDPCLCRRRRYCDCRG